MSLPKEKSWNKKFQEAFLFLKSGRQPPEQTKEDYTELKKIK